MREYELTVIINNDDKDTSIEKVKEILQKTNTTIVEQADWGNKKLAYEIASQKEAYYMHAKIETDPATIDTIISEFRIQPSILRYLFVQLK